MLGGPSYKWRAASYAKDVTDDLIEGPPGTSAEAGAAPDRVDDRRVMVVYGRDGEARRAMFDYLRALGLEPAEWRKLVAETEKGAPYIGEILERAFERAAAVVVLFTPDDEAKLRDELLSDGDPDYERSPTPQARPNVLFEAGMASVSIPTGPFSSNSVSCVPSATYSAGTSSGSTGRRRRCGTSLAGSGLPDALSTMRETTGPIPLDSRSAERTPRRS
jgi:hypothetical protein